MRRLAGIALLCYAFTCSVAIAQTQPQITVEGAEIVTTVYAKTFPFKLTAPKGGQVYVWTHPSEVKSKKKGRTLEVTAAPNGTYTFECTIGYIPKKDDEEPNQETVSVSIVIGSAPVPPGPGPDPKPPDPKPPEPKPPEPSPDAPIKAPGYRVVIVEESKERSKLPKEQYNILFNKQVRDFLNTNCVKDAENPAGAWRIWDQNSDFSNESKIWQEAMKRERKSVPWIIVSNGTTGYEGPLPKDVSSTLELLKKYLPKTKKGDK